MLPMFARQGGREPAGARTRGLPTKVQKTHHQLHIVPHIHTADDAASPPRAATLWGFGNSKHFKQYNTFTKPNPY